MLIADILHSCSNQGIAEAAVASVGGTFAATMRAEASRSGQSLGALAASLVRDFANDASEREWRMLTAAMAGADQPVLSGLRVIGDTMLARRVSPHAETHRRVVPYAAPSPSMAAAPCLLA